MGLDVSGCLKRYETHGVQFEYPDIWALTEEKDANGDIEVTVTTDGSVFWVLRILTDCPLPRDVISSFIKAFEEEYDDVDEYPRTASLANLPADSREVDFSCLELINSACVSCVRSLEFSLLVWWQGTDHELEEIRPVMEQMTDSVRMVR